MTESWDPRDPALEVGRQIVRDWEGSGGTGPALSIMIAKAVRDAKFFALERALDITEHSTPGEETDAARAELVELARSVQPPMRRTVVG